MGTEIPGADGPRAKYVFGVCVQQAHGRNSTNTSQPCGLYDPASGFQTYREHKLRLNSLKNIQDPKEVLGGKEVLKKGRTFGIEYLYLKKEAYMQNIYIYTHRYVHTCIHIYLYKTMKIHMSEFPHSVQCENTGPRWHC